MRGILTLARRWLVPAAIFCVIATAYALGTFAPFERTLMDSRFRLLPRGTTGNLVVVAIDARSLHALPTWPWPRDDYAQLLNRLLAAGAKTVAFDIDFSAVSTPSADDSFAAALARSHGRVILPVFTQREGFTNGATGHSYDTAPLPVFRHSTLLAAVNVFPGPDSLIRTYLPAMTFNGTPVPSLASMLDRHMPAEPGPFYLDYGIKISGVPVLSFVNVLKGRFDRAAVVGKNVIVGATAVELGDELAVPLHRTMAGPMLQALAYESLAQDRTLHRSGALPTLGLALLVMLILGRQLSAKGWRRGLFVLLAATAVLYVTSLALQAVAPFSLDLAPALFAAAALYVIGVLWEVEQQALTALKHRMSDLHRRAMMQSVLDDSFDGIVIAKSDGTIELANPVASRLLGYAPEELIGRPIDLFLAGATGLQEAAFEAHRPDLIPSTGSPPPVERQLTGRDGTTRTIEHLANYSELRVAPHRKEQHTHGRRVFIHIFRDITERKTAEIELRDAMQRAMAANRAKSEFLANMSHELRTPLNAILGFSEVIRDAALEPVPQRYRDYAKDINNSGQHLLSVINDILDLAKIETGHIELQEEEVAVDDLIAACLPIVGLQAKQSDIELKISLAPNLPFISADKLRLRQVMVNLLSNAIKFTPRAGKVTVSAALTREGGLDICVCDTGIGMKAEDIPMALEPFRQLESTFNRHYEGTGLGLPLARSLTRLHGGTLSIETELGCGTSVHVRLPPHRVLLRSTTLPPSRLSGFPSAA